MIEHIRLNKTGGLKSFLKETFLKLAIITVVATLAGYIAGNSMQEGFRNVTGFNKTETTETKAKEFEMLPTDRRYNENGNVAVGILVDTMNMTTNALNTVTNSKAMQIANDEAWKILYTTLAPLFKAMDWAAFWFTFTLAFIISVWLSHKIIMLKSKATNGGVDPRLIKNMELLEAKVNELVDHANTKKK